jgi:hypothetical protein
MLSTLSLGCLFESRHNLALSIQGRVAVGADSLINHCATQARAPTNLKDIMRSHITRKNFDKGLYSDNRARIRFGTDDEWDGYRSGLRDRRCCPSLV